jgi:hypothetical protein
MNQRVFQSQHCKTSLLVANQKPNDSKLLKKKNPPVPFQNGRHDFSKSFDSTASSIYTTAKLI